MAAARSAPCPTRAEDTFARFPSFPVRDVKQAADAANQIGFVCVKPTISINHLPQHLHHRETIRVVVAIVYGPREAVEIGRLVVGGFGLLDQSAGLGYR